MNFFEKDILDIFAEATAQTVSVTDTDGIEDDDDIIMSSDDYESIPELDEYIDYTEEMVNVMARDQKLGTEYLVEYDNLYKLMESKNIDASKAIQLVCEHNNIPLHSTCLLIESSKDMNDSLEETKAAAKSSNPSIKAKAINKLKNSKKQLQDLKKKGIKVLRKKNK